jgi:hypothetical protein
MLFVNFKTRQLRHKNEELTVACTMSALVPFGTTGKICLKSPQKTTGKSHKVSNKYKNKQQRE